AKREGGLTSPALLHPPAPQAVERTVAALRCRRALDPDGGVTPTGELLARFPLALAGAALGAALPRPPAARARPPLPAPPPRRGVDLRDVATLGALFLARDVRLDSIEPDEP